jgi:hypothetical protein
MIHFYGVELFAHHQNPKLDYHPLLAVRNLIQYIQGYPHWSLLLHPQSEHMPCGGVRFPLILTILHTVMDLL